MTDLLIYEFRRVAKTPLPYLIAFFLLFALGLSWTSLDSEESRLIREATDPVIQMQRNLSEDPELRNFKAALEDISTSEAMKMRYRNEISLIENSSRERLTQEIRSRYYLSLAEVGTAPQYKEDLADLTELITEASQRNAQNRNVPYLEHAADFSGYTYRLFQFTQNGMLILAALALGLMSPRLPKGSIGRRAGTSQLFTARVLALTITGCLVLILPKILASLLVLSLKGPGYLGLVLPFNPKDGFPLYQLMSTSFDRLLPFRAVSFHSLTTLRTAFIYLYLYEAAQIFLWVSLGLLAGVLTRRRYLGFAVPSAILVVFKVFYPVIARFGPAGFLFPVYHDALRDVIGSPMMALGMAYGEPPAQDYVLALSVMVLTGIVAVYLADLKEKRRLFHLDKGGDRYEDI